jgi:hypothetical protein
MSVLFEFSDPDSILRRATKNSIRRQSGTIADTVRHSVIHTRGPDSTLHHVVIAACPHPTKARSSQGEYYMIAYVSVPLDWFKFISGELANRYDISFMGPAGQIQKLPPSLIDMEELLPSRAYIGFDWLRFCETQQMQLTPELIKGYLVSVVNDLRSAVEPHWNPAEDPA